MAPPGRRSSERALVPEFLIFTEGEVTEEQYLNDLRRRCRGTVHVKIHDFHGTPISLVHEAKDVKKRDLREANRGRGRAFDEYWCVFDVDDHPNVKHACDLAAEHGIQVAASNPCVEIWFLLHFQDQSAYVDRHTLKSKIKARSGHAKALSQDFLDLLDENHEHAVARAITLDQKHEGDSTPFPKNNPSTGMWRLTKGVKSPATFGSRAKPP